MAGKRETNCQWYGNLSRQNPLLANGPECIEVRATLPYNGLLGKSPPVSDMPTNRTSACRHSEEEPQGADSFRVADYSSRIGGIGVGTGEWSHGLTPVRENPLPRRSTVRRAHLQSADKKEDALRLFLETRNHFKPAFFAGKLMLPTQSCLQSEWALLDTFPCAGRRKKQYHFGRAWCCFAFGWILHAWPQSL